MRAVGDESRPACQYEEGSLLARPQQAFDLQDSVGRRAMRVMSEQSLNRLLAMFILLTAIER
jgi:hypothetical protein